MKYPIIIIAAIIVTILMFVFGIIGSILQAIWDLKLTKKSFLAYPFDEYTTDSKGSWDWFPVFVKCNPNRHTTEWYKSYFHWSWGIN